jgi:methylenetetrahydrofolate reductase (NADPH)
MRNRSGMAAVRRLLDTVRFEVLPTPSAEERVCSHVPAGRTITVTASPSRGLEATLDLTERLAGHGYDVVPHLAARMIGGRAELKEIVDRLVPIGVRTVFVPGGDAEPGDGRYTSALELLLDLSALGRPFPNVGITGYPESHPTISDDLTVQSMWDKRMHSTYVVSNLTFDASAVSAWVSRMRARGITVPLVLGLPGPTDRTKLLAMATKIGVGESTRFLAKHRGVFARLAAPGGFTGERFLLDCARTINDPASLVSGLHVFTFNQIAEAEEWRRDLAARLTA